MLKSGGLAMASLVIPCILAIITQQPLCVLSIPALSMSFPAGMQQGVTNAYGVVYNVSRDWMSSSSFMHGRDPRLGSARLYNTSANAA